MNILVIGKFYSEGFALHIAETLTTMGHSVRRFEPGFKLARIGGRFWHRFDQVRGVIHSSIKSASSFAVINPPMFPTFYQYLCCKAN